MSYQIQCRMPTGWCYSTRLTHDGLVVDAYCPDETFPYLYYSEKDFSGCRKILEWVDADAAARRYRLFFPSNNQISPGSFGARLAYTAVGRYAPRSLLGK